MTGSQCAIPGCSGAVTARGWCHKHYGRWRRHGDPAAGRPRRVGAPAAPILDRFPHATARSIAEAVGVSRRTVVRWRAGRTIGDPDRVAVALGHHPDELWPDQANG